MKEEKAEAEIRWKKRKKNMRKRDGEKGSTKWSRRRKVEERARRGEKPGSKGQAGEEETLGSWSLITSHDLIELAKAVSMMGEEEQDKEEGRREGRGCKQEGRRSFPSQPSSIQKPPRVGEDRGGQGEMFKVERGEMKCTTMKGKRKSKEVPVPDQRRGNVKAKTK